MHNASDAGHVQRAQHFKAHVHAWLGASGFSRDGEDDRGWNRDRSTDHEIVRHGVLGQTELVGSRGGFRKAGLRQRYRGVEAARVMPFLAEPVVPRSARRALLLTRRGVADCLDATALDRHARGVPHRAAVCRVSVVSSGPPGTPAAG